MTKIIWIRDTLWNEHYTWHTWLWFYASLTLYNKYPTHITMAVVWSQCCCWNQQVHFIVFTVLCIILYYFILYWFTPAAAKMLVHDLRLLQPTFCCAQWTAVVSLSGKDLGQVVHTCASVTKQYNLVPVAEKWCPAIGKVTIGLASH